VADFDRDRWFTAEEAREYGMVDVVLDHRSQLPSGTNGKSGARLS
jgi:ATP-dependent Clp protease protease subunit